MYEVKVKHAQLKQKKHENVPPSTAVAILASQGKFQVPIVEGHNKQPHSKAAVLSGRGRFTYNNTAL